MCGSFIATSARISLVLIPISIPGGCVSDTHCCFLKMAVRSTEIYCKVQAALAQKRAAVASIYSKVRAILLQRRAALIFSSNTAYLLTGLATTQQYTYLVAISDTLPLQHVAHKFWILGLTSFAVNHFFSPQAVMCNTPCLKEHSWIIMTITFRIVNDLNLPFPLFNLLERPHGRARCSTRSRR